MNSRIKNDVKKIFEFWCEIKKVENPTKSTGIGHILQRFPEHYHDEQIIAQIPDFVYPFDFNNSNLLKYSFVLTGDDSKWRFGFIRHDPVTQTAMVVVTYLPWNLTFRNLLDLLAKLRTRENGEFESFLTEAYNKGVPDPGATLTVFYDAGENSFVFQRPSQYQLPSVLEDHNLREYYNFIEPKNMIAVFASMLAERRIIFKSSNLEKLSCCVQAANGFLYPMQWQHIFIPILPMKLKDMLMAPMPYLIGVPHAVFDKMTPDELGEVVVLNCDDGTFQSPYDDVHSLPHEIVHQMKKQLNNTNELIDDRLSKIFLRALVQLIGGYRDALRYQDSKISWNSEAFIQTRPPYIRDFLAKMMELQIFQQFIDERIDLLNAGLGISDEFEMEVMKYSEKFGKRSKNYKDIFRNVKDKTNPAVKTAVKTVKDSSKNVKSAYKDLKNKFRDITPHQHNTNFHSHISNSHHDGIDGLAGKKPGYNHSAPTSPVSLKRQQQNLSPARNHEANVNYTEITNPCVQSHPNGSYSSSADNSLLGKSPTISPASSVCSSEMNISQELQNHPLFKSPTVDRSSHKLNSNSSSTTLPIDASTDLMILDDNTSNFNVEDFDPLNQNAKPLPNINLTIPTIRSCSPSNLSTRSMLSSTAVANPIYPYFTPQHRNSSASQKLMSSSVGCGVGGFKEKKEEDFELLKKYGLDQFSLAPSGAGASNVPKATTSNRNWTTFD